MPETTPSLRALARAPDLQPWVVDGMEVAWRSLGRKRYIGAAIAKETPDEGTLEQIMQAVGHSEAILCTDPRSQALLLLQEGPPAADQTALAAFLDELEACLNLMTPATSGTSAAARIFP